MIAVGDQIPDFSTVDADGHRVDRALLLGRPGVVFFYPKAGSLGCTREAKGFSDRHEEFARRGVRVLGVSVDPVAAQRSFAEKCHLPFPLLPDPGREVARRFGVLGALGLARRVTFVFDAEGRVRHVTESLLPGVHVTEALRAVEGIAAERPSV